VALIFHHLKKLPLLGAVFDSTHLAILSGVVCNKRPVISFYLVVPTNQVYALTDKKLEVLVKQNDHSSERGQVLVLIALGLVVLLGFTALAIDGSMIYSDRRYGQNGADASTLAGGGGGAETMASGGVHTGNWSCTGSAVVNAMDIAAQQAIARAADNGFSISDQGMAIPAEIPEGFDGYVVTLCSQIGGNNNYIDIVVQLRIETNASFVHFVYDGPVVQEVTSVTRVRPRKLLAFGNAVVALNNESCSGQTDGAGMHGNAGVYIFGGGVWSNGCMRVDGVASDIQIPSGCISYFSCPNPASCGNINSVEAMCVVHNPGYTIQYEDYQLEQEPNCGVTDVAGDDIHWVDLTKTGNALKTEVDKLLNTANPITGLYCIKGSLKMTNNSDRLTGVNVTLYFRTPDGGIDNTGGIVDVRAVPVTNTAYTGPAIPGVAIYADAPLPTGKPTCALKLTGNAANYVSGVILAPGCDIAMLGNVANDFHHSQIVGWNVEVGGSAETHVLFIENLAVARPTYIDLWR
jgi:hypothetical protein